MLVLTRKESEKILIPECDLVLTVVSIKGNQVRLGISAPDHLTIFREEVWERGNGDPRICPPISPEEFPSLERGQAAS